MQRALTWSELLRVLPGLANAAIMAVVVVPMLAPSVSGYALSMVITPMPGGGNTEAVTSAPGNDGGWYRRAEGGAREKLTDQGGHSGREHGAALHDERHGRPHEDGQVASQPGKGKREIWKTEGRDLSQPSWEGVGWGPSVHLHRTRGQGAGHKLG